MESMVKTIGKLFVGTAALVWSSVAQGTPLPASLEPCGVFLVDKALSGDELLAKDGFRLLLAAVKAPEVWQSTDQYRSWPHAEKSRQLLESLTTGSSLSLYCEGETQTFDDRKIAHVLTETGDWLQHELVTQGSVMVLPRANHQSGLDALQAAEDIARQEKRGLWSELELETTADGDIPTGRLAIVTGKVLNAARAGNRIFLNFGDDWRKDFTVEIPTRVIRVYKKSGMDPLQLQGLRVEVRGWVTWRGGPHMLIEGPGQIRRLSSP